MERVLGSLLLVAIPAYFLFAWWKHLLTLHRVVLLIALEIGVISTFLSGQRAAGLGNAAGIVVLSLYLVRAME